MINFMCHENFEYTLGPLINFICGKNGSGKSAILTALTLCLGGKASSTNRGQSLKNFIKQGKDQAAIIVKIKNHGDTAYMQEEYGNTIIVERSFNRSGASSFKIKSERGRIVSTKKAELEEICEFFTLQMDNPMNVLSQDLARQFISGSSPSEKYKFFVKGVHLEQLDQDYRVLEETIELVEDKLGTKQDDLRILEDLKRKARVKLELSNKYETFHERIRNFSRQLAWAQVEEQERKLDTFLQELEKIARKINDAEGELQELDAAFQTAHADYEQTAQQHRQKEEDAQRIRAEKDEAKAEHDNVKTELSRDMAEQRNIRELVKEAESRITKTREAIETEMQHLEDVNGGSHTRLRAELEQTQQEAAEAKTQYNRHIEAESQLKQDIASKEETLAAKQGPIQRQKEEIESRQRTLNSLSANQDQQDAAFHERLHLLLRAIQNERSFSEEPVGPVGKYVRLRKPEWSSQLEKSFGATLSSFIVTSKRDMNVLSGLMKKTKCESPIMIGNRNHIDTRPQEPDPRFDTVLRALEIDDDLVRNTLVIQHGIEQTILIADMDEASRVMYSDARPRNVRRCFCINRHNKRQGHHLSFMRNGEPTQDPIHEWTSRPRMKTDIEVQIRLQQEAIQSSRQDLRTSEDERRAAQNDHERAKQAHVRWRRTEKELRIAFEKLDDAVDAAREAVENDSVEAGKLEAIKDALAQAQEEKSVHDGSMVDSVVAVDAKKRVMKEHRDRLIEIDTQIQSFESVARESSDDVQRKSHARQTALGDKNAAVARIEDAKRDQGTLQRRREQQTATVEDFTTKASAISPRVNIDPGETPRSLDAKLVKIQEDINKFNAQIGGSREEIAAEAQRTMAAFTQAREQLKALELVAQNLKEALVERKGKWLKFRGNISARAKIQFEHLLHERNFRGRVVTDHRRRLLNVQVRVSRLQIHTLNPPPPVSLYKP